MPEATKRIYPKQPSAAKAGFFSVLLTARLKSGPPETKNSPRLCVCSRGERFTFRLRKLPDQADGLFYVVMGLIDVDEGALLQALREAVVFFLRDILMRLIEQLQGAMQAAVPGHVGVHGRMIVQILAIVDRGFFDFVDGFIDLVNGFLFLVAQFAAIGTLQMGASGAQSVKA